LDPTTKWLVRITCLVFLGGVISSPFFIKRQNLENFCLKISKEYGSDTDQEIGIRKDCRKQPDAWGYGDW